MAVVSLLGLMLLVVVGDLTGVAPWQDDSVEPRLTMPGIEAAVGDAVAVSPERPARTDGLAVATAVPAARVGGTVSARSPSGVRLAVARLQPVAVDPPPAPAPPPPRPEPVSPPEPEEVPASSPPILVTAPEHGTQQPLPPVNAGEEPEEACEGDEYEVQAFLDPTAGEDGEVEIVVRRIEDERDDGEAHLFLQLDEVVDLLEALVSEGDCALVESYAGDAPEPAAGAPAAGRDP